MFFGQGDGQRPFYAERSACVRYADAFDILLLEAIKNYCGSLSERGTASNCRKLCLFASDDTNRDVHARIELYFFYFPRVSL